MNETVEQLLLKMTGKELARRANVTESMVSRWRHGAEPRRRKQQELKRLLKRL